MWVHVQTTVVLSTETMHAALFDHFSTEVLSDGALAFHLFMPSSKYPQGIKSALCLRMHPQPACPVAALPH